MKAVRENFYFKPYLQKGAKSTTRGCDATLLTRTFSSLLLVLTNTLQREPENAKDPHAVAIVEDTERIVGHIPLALSRIVFFKNG